MNKVMAFAHSQNIVLPSPDYYGYITSNIYTGGES